MQKFVAMLFALVAIGAVNAGVVDPAYRCGGLATQLQLRISDCDGYCRLMPGTLYNCENDFMPSSAAASLSLRVEICMNAGFCTVIINTELPNSSVQPGFVYTAKYSIVPNDVLSGSTVEFRASILHTDNLRVEVCVSADVDILTLP
ncbi:uncharacterized protein LOC110857773 isoform X4 [Folsomia candida]|uniref:Exodeoxyribonuclease 7 large subunit n=1 Tax=Folsomia candida TaxID=158441 RepID=A0A226DHG9_FOLCA|nr:uncharacterized protein LOC110857773 isoform X4 [Folsomia candida]OXA44683.1 Exodeoxyribonuclease 7 large subunit [Folsomia candida]